MKSDQKGIPYTLLEAKMFVSYKSHGIGIYQRELMTFLVKKVEERDDELKGARTP